MTLRRACSSTVALAVGLLLVACSSIEAGYITNKAVEPTYTWVQMLCTSFDKNGVCVSQMPIYHTVPEKYRFDIADGDEEGSVHVSYDTFSNHQVGDWVDFSRN